MAGRQKCLYLHHEGESQHQCFTFVSLQGGDHGSEVRIFCRPFLHYDIVYCLFTWHSISRTSSVTRQIRINVISKSVILKQSTLGLVGSGTETSNGQNIRMSAIYVTFSTLDVKLKIYYHL